jgi:glycine cleavage system H protein
MNDELMTYMGYEWIQIEDDTLTIGINEDGLDEFAEVNKVHLPAESEKVEADEVCGELETDEGPLNLYCPVDGKVVEINAAVVENPQLIFEDPYGDGWLFRVEMNNPEDIHNLNTDDDDE